MKLLTVYYNDLDTIDKVIQRNCPYVNLPEETAETTAEEKLKNGEWLNYAIPELRSDYLIMDNIPF